MPHSDFFNRWQQPGDEGNTNVPAYSPTINTSSTSFYTQADLHVTSASYIKLRDISLSYTLPDAIIQKINASRVSFRLMLNNVMLWKENDKGSFFIFVRPIELRAKQEFILRGEGNLLGHEPRHQEKCREN